MTLEEHAEYMRAISPIEYEEVVRSKKCQPKITMGAARLLAKASIPFPIDSSERRQILELAIRLRTCVRPHGK